MPFLTGAALSNSSAPGFLYLNFTTVTRESFPIKNVLGLSLVSMLKTSSSFGGLNTTLMSLYIAFNSFLMSYNVICLLPKPCRSNSSAKASRFNSSSLSGCLRISSRAEAGFPSSSSYSSASTAIFLAHSYASLCILQPRVRHPTKGFEKIGALPWPQTSNKLDQVGLVRMIDAFINVYSNLIHSIDKLQIDSL